MTEAATKWIAALRSGQYKQGKGRLCHVVDDEHQYEYCAFGVACEVLGLEGRFETRSFGYYHYSYFDKYGHCFDQTPTNVVLEELGLSRVIAREIIECNDTHGFTFDELANYIERVLSDETT